jgi:hypothetical protein
MHLTFGALGEEVRNAQQQMNKLGSMLELDGVFGHACEDGVHHCRAQMPSADSAIYDDDLDHWLAAQPDPVPGVDTSAVNFIAHEEIGSLADYNARWSAPCYPGEESGITIGVGYDLRFQKDQFEVDWKPLLSAPAYAALLPVLGRSGDVVMAKNLRDVRIAWTDAWQVFTRSTLPHTLSQVRQAFPGQEALSPLSRGALVSLVYNRGVSFDGDRRSEMRSIRDAIAAKHFDEVPQYFRSMQRLWPNSPGLRARREKEAELFERGLAS